MAETQYLAMRTAAKECIGISRLFAFAACKGIPQSEIIVDNQGAIKMAKRDASGNRTKRIGLMHDLVGDLLNIMTFIINYCSSNGKAADIFPKPFGELLIQKHSSKIRLHNIQL